MRPQTPYLLLALWWLGIFLPPTLSAQQRINGRIVDGVTEAPVPYANLIDISGIGGSMAEADGSFVLYVDSFPVQIIVSSLGYRNDTVTFDADTYQFVRLTPISELLPTIEVTAEEIRLDRINEVEYDPEDMIIWRQQLFVLTRLDGTYDYRICVYDADGRLRLRHDLDIGKIKEMRVNCLEHLYLRTEEFLIRFDYYAGRFSPVEKITPEDYQRLYGDCRAKNDDYFILERQRYQGLLKQYLLGSKTDGAIKEFDAVVQEEVLRNFHRDKYRIARGEAASNTGDLTYADNQALRLLQEDADFYRDIFYKNPVVNRIYGIEDLLLIFNYDRDSIQTYGPDGTRLSSIPLLFNKDRIRDDPKVFHDPVRQEFYHLDFHGGNYRLKRIDLQSGDSVDPIPLKALNEWDKVVVLKGSVFILGRSRRSGFPPRPELLLLR